MYRNIYLVKMSITPKEIYEVNKIFIKDLTAYFTEVVKPTLIFKYNYEQPK